MSHPIDDIMERASAALVATDYLACERLCLEALTRARAESDFDRYARILLPLQEARRLRRQIAAESGVTVLNGPRRDPADVLDDYPLGCLLLIAPPHTTEDEIALRKAAHERGLFVEVLLFEGDELQQPYEDQIERQGDAILAGIPEGLSPVERVDALAAILDRVGDHEIGHQRLAEAARAAAKAAAGG